MAYLAQKEYFWKFDLIDFYLLIVPCHAARFLKNS